MFVYLCVYVFTMYCKYKYINTFLHRNYKTTGFLKHKVIGAKYNHRPIGFYFSAKFRRI